MEKKAPGEKLLIVCTTGMLGDVVENICGEYAEVKVIMGPGVDPHLYKPNPADIRLLQNSDVIVHNGLHLEGKMGEIFEKLDGEKIVIRWSDGIPENQLLHATEDENSHDPHIWFDSDLFMQGARYFTKRMGESDTVNAQHFKKNLELYLIKVNALEEKVSKMIDQIPPEKRVLITSHDAFSYFGRKYGFRVRGLQGISTVAEFGVKDKVELVNYITKNQVPALFVESSVSSRSLESVIEACHKKGHKIKIGGTLLSDTMDEKGKLGGTYLGMIEYNIQTILEGINE
ncbi:MAG: zinc ABC transporter substrate-binding protein [Crocinitomicaceae bacterium]